MFRTRFAHPLTSATLSLVALVALAAHATATVVIPLTNDPDESDSPAFGTTLDGPLSDPFAYDPITPNAALPQGDYTVSPPDLWHSPNGLANQQYAVLFDAIYNEIHIDFYPRTDDPSAFDRDDNLTFIFYNGDWLTPVDTVTGVFIDNTAGATGVDALPATEADRFLITTSPINWSIAELRATGVPEPSAILLSCVGLLAVVRRRRG